MTSVLLPLLPLPLPLPGLLLLLRGAAADGVAVAVEIAEAAGVFVVGVGDVGDVGDASDGVPRDGCSVIAYRFMSTVLLPSEDGRRSEWKWTRLVVAADNARETSWCWCGNPVGRPTTIC
ncbi:hypothetical protein F4808DRAFT_422936 [Astrocystis sublimbata]|nr:hypothetical protein F4808DRAFT_422936 [Astrocystis sublimbata]